jgi:nitrogen regulatory protein PII
MKLVTAIFKPSRLDAVIDALGETGVSGLTVSEVRGYGRQQGKTEVYRGAEFEVACSAADAERVVEAISASANTGTIGDGKVFVLDLESVVRIRTGERNEQAIGS